MDQFALAYLAGVLDSDGHITVQRFRKVRNGRSKPNTYYCLKVGIAGCRTPPHELAREMFGGKIYPFTPKNPFHRKQYQWSVSGPTAKTVLLAVLPFLRVKRRQAEQGIAFQDMISRHREAQRKHQKPPYRVTDEMQCEREVAWRSVTVLNQSKLRSQTNRPPAGREYNGFPQVGHA
jgi:hypothetical protein